ncbi:MAG: CotH kinase family protein [Planctomycetes bacterium]|nr:CotH kinase family protein [Planctomycetota bacterium]
MKLFRKVLLLLLWMGAGWAISGCSPSESASPTGSSKTGLVAPRPDAAAKMFEGPDVLSLSLVIEPAEQARLAENAREYVRCRLVETGGDEWSEVGVKLKGAAGSFNELDGKPALTLKLDKFRKKSAQSFHGLTKFHLNNSVQDETYLHEWVCSGLFREAGVPTPRVAHARVVLNGRDLGLYVLKESFDRQFIARHFASHDGNLYDGGFCQDLDADLERDVGSGDDTHADQHALLEACRLPNLEERWAKMATHLDVEAFLTFAAMELMTGHWDGYCLNRNNYRLYFEAPTQKGYFLPHGMDQMFGDPGAGILDRPNVIVAGAVFENPVWRTRFRERIRELLPLFDPPDRLLERVDRMVPRLQAALASFDPGQAAAYPEKIEDLKNRLTARAANLREQSEQPDPPPPGPLEFEGDAGVELADWQPASESDDAVLEVVELPMEQAAYLIRCGGGGPCVASWRRQVLLSRGEYRLVASAKTTDVVPRDDERGTGAGLRISGSSRERGLEGTSADWQPLEYRFSVAEDVQEIVLVAELRATAGEVQFDTRSLKLFRLPD